MDSKLSIHFGEDKTKPILFASKRRSKNGRQLNSRYNHKYKAALACFISHVSYRMFHIACRMFHIACFISHVACFISSVRVRRENVLWTNGTKGYKQDKREIKFFL